MLSPSSRQVACVLLTSPPLKYIKSNRNFHLYISVRLACLKCAASVHPEPESNSCLKLTRIILLSYFFTLIKLTWFMYFMLSTFTLLGFTLLFIFQCAISSSPDDSDYSNTQVSFCQQKNHIFSKKIENIFALIFYVKLCAKKAIICDAA